MEGAVELTFTVIIPVCTMLVDLITAPVLIPFIVSFLSDWTALVRINFKYTLVHVAFIAVRVTQSIT